jgi:hypothetical protein
LEEIVMEKVNELEKENDYQKLRMDKAAVEKRKDIREREDVEMAADLPPYLMVASGEATAPPSEDLPEISRVR